MLEVALAGVSLRQAIVDEAARWLGTPFAHRQRVLGAGVDCAQLLAAVYESVGLLRGVDLGRYPRDWMLHQSDERYLDALERVAVPVTEPEPGDVAVFRVGRAVAHAGIVVSWPLIIHAQTGATVQRINVMEHGALLTRFAGWWSIVTAARLAAAPKGTEP